MEVMCRVRSSVTGQANPNKIKSLLKKRKTELKAKVDFPRSSSLADDQTTATTNVQIPNSVTGTKRKSEESQQVKKSNLDHCQGVLAKVMRHKWSVPFRRPVDPCASGDYFQVIKHPIDFATIKRKLQMNKYTDCEQFEADVRLIFSNATSYHPPQNWVHIYATKLSKLFDILWTPVKPKLIKEPTVKQNLSFGNESVRTTCCAEDKCPKTVQNHSPSTALHIAKMKSRFADTILKAQTKNDHQKGNRTDGMTSQYEKEKLRQRLEDEVKAAESAFRMKAEQQRQQERQAARASIEKMERSIVLDDNLLAMKELEVLIGNSQSWSTKNPLERLGLYLKSEYRLNEDDELILQVTDLEDGEILD
ncbi:hypothetical protein RND81_11G109400 [Saponaria officinalis]|uniref:Bromo domain-containing protein n=1 Tax=Saponaria officinalis TaxID=3572 RepID=A0AAW1HLM7_SAPOF